MRFIFIIIAIFILGGCTTKVPSVTEFRITTQHIESSFARTSCQDNSLRVVQAFSSNTLMSKSMSYALGEYKQDTYTQSEWAESPNKAITAQIIKSAQVTKLFRSVQSSKSRSKSGMVLEANIEEFLQHFSQDEASSFANAVITFTLIDAKSATIVDSKTFNSKVEVKSLNAQGGVIALNKALENILRDMSQWLGENCR